MRDLYYHYAALLPRHIRLIRLLPRLEYDNSDPVFIELHTARLDEYRFIALSYTWGPATLEEQDATDAQTFTTVPRCYPIYCGGKIIRVTRSLRDALIRIRQFLDPASIARYTNMMDKPLDTNLIWADGICINQEDLQERAEQVKLMAEIYTQASLTFAYLGEPDRTDGRTHEGMQFAKTLCKLFLTWREELDQIMAHDIDNEAIYARIGIGVPSTEEWAEWAIFMSREWFFRTWVLQEAVLSKENNLYFLCGPLLDRASSLLFSLDMLYGARWNDFLLLKLDKARKSNARYQRYYEKIESWVRGTHPHHSVLRSWYTTEKLSYFAMSYWQLSLTSCSDPRDKIYSTLGLAAEWQNLDESLIRVDYSLNVAEVFSRATKHIIMRTGSLDILSSATIPPENVSQKICGLPSWCPNYAVSGEYPQNVLLDYPDKDIATWLASGGSKSKITGSDAIISQLSLQGIHIDTVEAACLFCSVAEPFNSPAVLRFIFEQMQKTAVEQRVNKTYSFANAIALNNRNKTAMGWLLDLDTDNLAKCMTHGLLARLNKSLIGGHNLVDDPDIEPWTSLDQLVPLVKQLTDLEPEMKKFLPIHEKLVANIARKERTKHSLTDAQRQRENRWRLEMISNLFPNNAELNYAHRGWMRIKSACRNRSLFITENGRVGIGNNILQPGDQVWLLAGAKVPFLLRGANAYTMQVVGEAYVDGVMYGEMWPVDERAVQDITLH